MALHFSLRSPIDDVSPYLITKVVENRSRNCRRKVKGVLLRRAADLPPPIQMCDALSRNLPHGLKTILGNCLAHGRRKFVDAAERFPEECRHVLESFAAVYHNDAIAEERNLTPAERLLFHQAESGPVMEELHAWLVRQFAERHVEPNSGLGKAISYLLRHGEALTLFLRVAGAPLDNNLCERALKKAQADCCCYSLLFDGRGPS